MEKFVELVKCPRTSFVSNCDPVWHTFAKAQLTGALFSNEDGGLGWTIAQLGEALYKMTRDGEDFSSVFSLAVHNATAVSGLANCASKKSHSATILNLVSGRKLGALAMTEQKSGSDTNAIETKLTTSVAGYTLNGKKTFVTNGSPQSTAIVFAKDHNNEMVSVIVDLDQETIAFDRSFEVTGLEHIPLTEVSFDHTPIHSDQLIATGGVAAAHFQSMMAAERSLLAAVHVGLMEKLLKSTVCYAQTRQSGGFPLTNQPAVRHRLAEMTLSIDMAKALMEKTLQHMKSPIQAIPLVCSTKVSVTRCLAVVASNARHIFGAQGVLCESQVSKIEGIAAAASIYSGTEDIQLEIIARWL